MKPIGLPLANHGTPMPAPVGAGGLFIPKGTQNPEVAKDFSRFFMQPEVLNANLKGGLGRTVPSMPRIAKEDPWWLDPSDPHRAPFTKESVLGPTTASYYGYNPAWGQVSAEQLWGGMYADVIKSAMKPAEAVDKAFRRAEAIFSRYVFA